MRGTTKIKVKMEVIVEVDFDYDNRFRQASITSARIRGKDNVISSRTVYATMSGGDYTNLDAHASKCIIDSFKNEVQAYVGKSLKEFPSEEIRSAPCYPSLWFKILSPINPGSGIPLRMVMDAAEKMGALLEPVLSRTPTVYIWPQNPSLVLDGEKIKKVLGSDRMPNIEEQEDGSWKVTWRAN